MRCPKCGFENSRDYLLCQRCWTNLHSGPGDKQDDLKPHSSDALSGEKTSANTGSPVPAGLNWGAFVFPYFWSSAHGLQDWARISFYFPNIASFYLLINGNRLAWENRSFASVDEFKKVEKAWTRWGLIGLSVGVGLSILCFVFLQFMPDEVRTKLKMPGAPILFQAGAAVAVTPYPGSTQVGAPTNDTDAGRPYTTTSYTAQAGFEAVIGHFRRIAETGHSYSWSSDDTSADILIGGKTRIRIESKGTNQTSYTIIEYK